MCSGQGEEHMKRWVGVGAWKPPGTLLSPKAGGEVGDCSPVSSRSLR